MWLVHFTSLEDCYEDDGGVAWGTEFTPFRSELGAWTAKEAYPCMGSGWPLPFGAAETGGEYPCHCGEHHPVLHAGALLVYHRGTGGSGIQPGLPCRVGSPHSSHHRWCTVVRTWGAHPKALDDVDWKWLEGRMFSAECVAIGERGLDESGQNMAHQEVAFKRQVQLAHQLGKPLVLHLRGQNASRSSAIYGRALAITTNILRKQHPVYLHSGWPTHVQECDMESRGSLNWEVLSQTGIIGEDGRSWHHRSLARGLCVCPESTGGVAAGSGYIVLPSRLQWGQSVCVCDRWIMTLNRELCTGCWGRVTTTTRLVVGLL